MFAPLMARERPADSAPETELGRSTETSASHCIYWIGTSSRSGRGKAPSVQRLCPQDAATRQVLASSSQPCRRPILGSKSCFSPVIQEFVLTASKSRPVILLHSCKSRIRSATTPVYIWSHQLHCDCPADLSWPWLPTLLK